MKATASILIALVVLLLTPVARAGTQSVDSSKSMTETAAPAPALCNWTGFFLGAHGGYTWGDLSFTELNEFDPSYEFDQESFFGGGQVGFDWQFHPMFVLGIEGTFSGSSIDSDFNLSKTGGERSLGNVTSDWLATIGGRVGVSFFNNALLLYAKGGVAFTSFDYETQEAGGGEHFSASDDRTAGFIGGGLEYRWNCHWSAKLEYAHYFFGDESVSGQETTGGPGVARDYSANSADRDSIAAGLNFRF